MATIILISLVVYVAINAIMGVLDAPAGLITTILGFDNNVLAFVEFCIGLAALLVAWCFIF